MFVYIIPFLLFSLPFVFGDSECPNVATPGSDRRTVPNFPLRLVQYNVEWLFIDYNSAADCPGNNCPWHNVSEANIHLSYVSNVLRTLQPDILNLCEVEGCDELNMVISQLDPSYRAYLKQGTDTATGQNVGMITRIDPLINLYRTENRISYPIPGSQCGYTGTPSTSGVSKHYITEFKINGIYIAMIGAHLVAYPTDHSRCAQREAQAQVLQNIIVDYIKKGYEIIVSGDMNDFDAEVMDLNSDKPSSRTLDILKGSYGENIGTYTLTSVASKIPQSQRYSDWWDSDSNCGTTSQKDYSMIDHILVTNKLADKIVNAFIYHGYSEYCGKLNSDHYPVVIDLVL